MFFREGGPQLLAQSADIFGRWGVILFQRDLDDAVIDADRRPIREGEIIEARREPDIVYDELEILLRDHLSDFFSTA